MTSGDTTSLLLATIIAELMDSSTSSEESSSDEEKMNQDVSPMEPNSAPSHSFFNNKISLAAGITKQPQLIDHFNHKSTYSDDDFKLHFRVTRSTFLLLLDCLNSVDFRSDVTFHGGQHPLTAEEMLYITLDYLANEGPIKAVADRFNRSESTVLFVVEKVCECLFQHQSNFIKWPLEEEIAGIESKFKESAGFPGIIGVLDSLHIRIRPPIQDLSAYLNYKKFHSIILMCVVLPDKKFSYAFTGYPGSNQNFNVFKKSGLYDKLHSENCSGLMDLNRYHLIADSSFELNEWLMTPFNNHSFALTPQQERFNKKLHDTRSVVHQTFNELTNRFKRLSNINASIPKCVNYIVASCVIHNFCIENEDYWDFCTDQLFLGEDEGCPAYTGIESDTEKAISKRNMIASTLL